ncbi:MAG: radical SAM protein [Nitrospirae bacterium]|nr:radical SAM protein [Nitrospirota bacterium]
MKLRILLISPWIYDFAAMNLWARPLGLLRVAEHLSSFDTDLALIDCAGSSREAGFGTGKYPKEPVEKPSCLKKVPRQFGRYGISVEDFIKQLKSLGPPDLIFVTSIMSYWYPGVKEAIGIAREIFPKAPVILGGIYATLWERHAASTSGADFIYSGPVSRDITFVLNTFGFRLKKKSTITPPSPHFGKGEMGGFSSREIPYYRLGLYSHYPFAPLLTSTGCPDNCAYCGSQLLSDSFFQRDSAEVISEIKELHGLGTRDFAFYDDALLIKADSHIKPVLREVIDMRLPVRFHCPNGLHARLIDNELAYLMRASGFKTLRLSLETVNRERQNNTGGKVSSGDLQRAVGFLKKHGFTKKDIGIYLMYGLPGQGLDEVKEGIAFLKSLDVKIHLTEFSPVPGTRSWDEFSQKGIITSDIDPLLTNNTVFSFLFSGYDPHEVEMIKLDVKEYNNLQT